MKMKNLVTILILVLSLTTVSCKKDRKEVVEVSVNTETTSAIEKEEITAQKEIESLIAEEEIAEPPKRDIVKYRELTEYVIKGDIENVKLLIKAGVNVNSIFGDFDEDEIPLHVAASDGDMAMIKVLVEAGANVNTISNWNMSAIDFTDRQDIAEYLIANGSDMKRLNIVSWAGFGFLEKVVESLRNKESIETKSGFSGLHHSLLHQVTDI